ncbi:erythromycin esterase family protein [Actinomadura yumaensis]|uniref:erythromycin esterase family protein n=1 Tax=Actinomadura yumaensis TaxID=111807 RepID=UPI00361FA296
MDDHITAGAGTLDDVMERGFSHRFGTVPANRELVRWMRAYNEEHGEKLRFFGFDGPLEYWAESPRQALIGLYELLDGPFTDAVATRRPSKRCWARTTGGRTRPRPWTRRGRWAGPPTRSGCG